MKKLKGNFQNVFTSPTFFVIFDLIRDQKFDDKNENGYYTRVINEIFGKRFRTIDIMYEILEDPTILEKQPKNSKFKGIQILDKKIWRF